MDVYHFFVLRSDYILNGLNSFLIGHLENINSVVLNFTFQLLISLLKIEPRNIQSICFTFEIFHSDMFPLNCEF